jgi:deferrochelatase/peroxidase EfeB
LAGRDGTRKSGHAEEIVTSFWRRCDVRRPERTPRPTRRRLVQAVAGLTASAAAGLEKHVVAEARADPERSNSTTEHRENLIESFWGPHQAGITTSAQRHTYTAALDLVSTKRDDLIALLRVWTSAAAAMSTGQPVPPGSTPVAPDSGETIDLPAARLTLTFGFGAGLFIKDRKDRYGLAAHQPQALVDLPSFNGDQLVQTRTGGDLSVQSCADDPQVAFHAVRQLVRLAHGVAKLRWAQTGFIPGVGSNETPRNLMGFKDGTGNPSVGDAAAMQNFVWVGDEGPDWMRGGSYVVFRRIRIALEHWDRMPLDFQERTFGRHKVSGAPPGRNDEFDPLDLNAVDEDGNFLIPESAHVRLAAPASNNGAQILRRPYSYNDGVNFTIERWPPWRQGLVYDAGLFFVCYQRDPRTGFIKIFDKLAKFDMLNQFVTHTGGGLFACPGGVAPGEFVGQRLIEST